MDVYFFNLVNYEKQHEQCGLCPENRIYNTHSLEIISSFASRRREEIYIMTIP